MYVPSKHRFTCFDRMLAKKLSERSMLGMSWRSLSSVEVQQRRTTLLQMWNWGAWWLQICGKGLPSAHGLCLCNELKLPSKDEIHIQSVSEALSGAGCPEALSQSTVSTQHTSKMSEFAHVSDLTVLFNLQFIIMVASTAKMVLEAVIHLKLTPC